MPARIEKEHPPAATQEMPTHPDAVAIDSAQVASRGPNKARKLHRADSAHSTSSPNKEEDTTLFHKRCTKPEDHDLPRSSYSANVSRSQAPLPIQEVPNATFVGPINPSEWDLPPTIIRPKTLLIEDCPYPNPPTALNPTFLDYDDYEDIGIGPQHHNDLLRVSHRTILLKADKPVAIYAFPLHGSIQIRGKGRVNTRLVRNSTHLERERHPYSFNFGPLMDGLTIHSTAPLPKIRLDYHLYKPGCQQGFPRTLPPRAWWTHSKPSPGFFKRLKEIEPMLGLDMPIGLVGACFTVQPMNTLYRSFRNFVLEEHDERLGETVQWKRKQEWAVRARIGGGLVQLAKVEDMVRVCPAALESRETVA